MKSLVISFLFVFGWVPTLLGHACDSTDKKACDTTSKIDFTISADLVSRYIWRGTDYGNSPAVQPTLAVEWNGFELGSWGSYGFSSYSMKVNDSVTEEMGHFAEIDWYLSYKFKWFTLMVYDYFTMNGMNPNSGNNYFDFKNSTTGHTLEGSLTFEGPDPWPVTCMVSTLFYGADKDQDSTGTYGLGTKNNFSTYVELGYTYTVPKIEVELKPFIGASLKGSGWYGPDPGIINVGLTASKEIPITRRYGLPVEASIIANPKAGSMFLVFGITL